MVRVSVSVIPSNKIKLLYMILSLEVCHQCFFSMNSISSMWMMLKGNHFFYIRRFLST